MSVISIFQNFKDDILDLICPKVCLACGSHIQSDKEDVMCPDCWLNLSTVDLYEMDKNEVTDIINQHVTIEYGCCYLKFQKGENVQELIHNLKYYNHPELGVRLGRIAAHQLKKHDRFLNVDYILPVPMHPKKQKKRGYNQAERIAAGLSEVYGIPIREDILKKTENTGSQTKMDKSGRMQNSKKIFDAVPIKEVCHKHFLIVDDVFTTGSTLSCCAEKLKEAMPDCKISVFALARA